MTDEGPIKRTTARIPEALHKRAMRHADDERGETLEAFVRFLIEDYFRKLDGKDGPVPVPQPHRAAHEMLETVLTEGNAKQREWIVGNLATFVEAIRAGTPARAARRAGGKS